MDLVQLLSTDPATAHLVVNDHRRPPRPGAFHPIGVMWHHTASSAAGLRIVRDGRSDLPGPLANINIARDAQVHVVCDGRANDSGYGISTVLNEVRRSEIGPHTPDAAGRRLVDDTGGSAWFFDVEVDNTGVGEPYPLAQLDALVRVTAAICRANGWGTGRCLHHRQWTRRKIDMSYRGDLWFDVAMHLLADPTLTPEAPVPDTTIPGFAEHAYRRFGHLVNQPAPNEPITEARFLTLLDRIIPADGPTDAPAPAPTVDEVVDEIARRLVD